MVKFVNGQVERQYALKWLLLMVLLVQLESSAQYREYKGPRSFNAGSSSHVYQMLDTHIYMLCYVFTLLS